MKLKVQSSTRESWCSEKVIASSDKASVVIDIKDPSLHGKLKPGSEITLGLPEGKSKKPK